jgi:septum formation protein
MKKIILASESPRRKDILRQIGLKFRVDASGCDETLNRAMKPEDLALFLSRKKAGPVAERHRNSIVIAADTVVVFRGRVLGKPHTAKEAMGMLAELNGRVHTVITGFTVKDTDTGKEISRCAKTKVFFRKLTPTEIETYVRSGEPLDKAGGYAIQGLGALLVNRIEGDYYNVVGLPLSMLVECLKEFGVNV